MSTHTSHPGPATPTTSALCVLEAKPHLHLIGNLAVVILGIPLVLVLSRIRGSFFHPFLLAASALIVLYAALDHILWLRRGVQRVEVFPDRLVFLRRSGGLLVLTPDRIRVIDPFSKLGRRTVNVVYDTGAVLRGPGMAFFTGPRVRLTDDAFNDQDFDRFLETLRNTFPDLLHPPVPPVVKTG